MSKTIETQIEKCRFLIGKLQEKLPEAEARGITADRLDNMNKQLVALAEASAKCDDMRRQLGEMVKTTNTLLTEVKDDYSEAKKKIKSYYPQERWIDYGVMDKR